MTTTDNPPATTTAPACEVPAKPMLKDPELKRALQELRRTNNTTNWWYIARAYLIGALAIGGAIAFHQNLVEGAGWHWLWCLPVFFVSVLVIGATQHQLAGAGHEATHYVLFRNRTLNDLASDWLCMFPLLTATHIFRQYHLCHHQFINDPKNDPDYAQLNDAGQWLGFPVSKRRFLLSFLRQFTLIPLVRYVLVRGKTNSLGAFNNPYADPSKPVSKWPNRILMLFVNVSVLSQVAVAYTAPLWAVFVVPAVLLTIAITALLMIPRERYSASKLIPPISPRANLIGQLIYLAALHCTLSSVQILTEAPAWIYFALLWIVPLLTAFPLCMVLRQQVQHGNGDRGWLTNTRTFLVNPFIRYAVFPFGMDYHLPHHMFCTVPHFNLPKLHEFLRRYPEYAKDGIVVEGYFFPPKPGPERNPTVLEVLGPEYHKSSEEVFIDTDATALAKQEEAKIGT